LKRLLPVALERAIREVVTPVVERSVTIACMTTRELVLKDYAAEPDEAALRRAAHLMAASLAGSLALVTCKEPLRVSAANALRGLLAAHQAAAEMDPAVVEQAVAVACSDNLELGCNLIEAAAQDKARRDVDDALTSAYAARRKHLAALGASGDADRAAAGAAYRRACLRWHPDKFMARVGARLAPAERAAVQARVNAVSQAVATLFQDARG
jgi:CCR4-NOT transcription complex subunit 1